MAIVISTGSAIDFCFMSDTMKSLPRLTWPKKGAAVPRSTATARLDANARRGGDGERDEADIDIMDWLGGTRSAPASGQVIGLGGYGKTLTVLTCLSSGRRALPPSAIAASVSAGRAAG